MFKESNKFEKFESKVWLSSPTMHGPEIEYVKEAYETNWMSTVGKNINEVEKLACEYIGCKYAVALSAGTASLHLAMKLAGIEAYKTTYTAELMSAIKPRKMGFYEKYIKRGMDVICASAAILCFSPIYAGVALLVKIKLGSPVIFTQDRPGLVDKDGRETIFKMYKFRTMTDERDEEGNLLPDEVRLTKFGAWLRKTSLDELPEAFNILNGDSGIIGTTKKNLDFTGVSLA